MAWPHWHQVNPMSFITTVAMKNTAESLYLNEVLKKAGSRGLCSHMQLDCRFSLTQAKAHHVIIKVRANVHRQEYVSCDEAVLIHSKEPCIEIRGNLHHAHHRSNTQHSVSGLLLMSELLLNTTVTASIPIIYFGSFHIPKSHVYLAQ